MPEAQIRIEWAADAAALADAIADQRLFRIYATWLGMPDYPGLPALASIDAGQAGASAPAARPASPA